MAMWRSKLGNQYPKAEIEKLDREHHAMLKQLRASPENSKCAECGSSDTTWASVNLGVFVCMRCSDVHRHLGTHISKMKGCGGTYLWGPDEIEQMKAVGNQRASEVFCARGAPKMSSGSSKEELVDFCTKKYSALLWASDDLKRVLAQGDKISVVFEKTCHEERQIAPRDCSTSAACIAVNSKSRRASTKCSAPKGLTTNSLPTLLSTEPKVGCPIPDWDDIFFQFEDETTQQVPDATVASKSPSGFDLQNALENCFRTEPNPSFPEYQVAVPIVPTSHTEPKTTNSLPSEAAMPSRHAVALETLPAEIETKKNALDMDTFFQEWGL